LSSASVIDAGDLEPHIETNGRWPCDGTPEENLPMIVRERRWSSRHARSYAVGKLVAWEYKSKLG
jgi:hypothetical protein